MSIAFFIVSYLAFSASGWLAVVKFFTYPHTEKSWPAGNSYRVVPGLDLSWCECVVFAAISLLPFVNISMNLFWLWVLRQKIKRRPLVNWPRFVFQKGKLPKCPVAIQGRKL